MAVAKKSSSRKKLKKAKKQCQQDLAECETQADLCGAQGQECVAFFCAGLPSCPARVKRCCAFLGKCDSDAFLRCLSALESAH
jgi:hypothetical protein